MKIEKRLMSNKIDKVIDFICPECGETLTLFRIIEFPNKQIVMEYECLKCSFNGLYPIEFLSNQEE
jgi:predicted RNA-binding Zn-ribbon protein involved in translation (DUF1610 family)